MVTEHEGPFDPASLDGFWCQKPLRLRGAFVSHPSWPSWDDVVELVCADDSEARIIQHTPGKLESFDLEFGPFNEDYIQELGSDDRKWTLLVNDVDRYVGDLADWLDQTFSFLPRWRRDDAQISIATIGGGIGPHVDNYDVFLIQASGQRTWKVSTRRLSEAEERSALVPDIMVRILDLDTEYDEFVMQEGDVLYLPPRTVHWGTALTDDCITMSVGCRAPAANELVARMAEDMMDSVSKKIVQRYSDPEIIRLGRAPGPTIDAKAKETMKKMVHDAITEAVNDELAWDELIGRISTDSKRYSEMAVQPYEEIYDDIYLEAWGDTAKEALERVLDGTGTLQRAEGIPLATSECRMESRVHHRLFALGEMWEVVDNEDAGGLFDKIERGERIVKTDLDAIDSKLLEIIIDLVDTGFLYASD